MKLTADMGNQDPKKAIPRDLEEAPRGTYAAEITACDVVDPDNGKDRRIEVVARILEPDNYWPLRDYINVVSEKAVWKYDQFLMSVGVLTPTKRKASWDPAAQVGKKVMIMVRQETRQVTGPDGTTEARTSAKIGGWLPKGSKTASKAADTVVPEESSTDEEITLVMHGAAADENEDQESIDYLTETAAEYELDPNDFDTWAELAEELTNLQAQGDEGEDEDEGGEEDEDTDTDEDEDDLDALGAAGDEEDAAAQARLEELAGDAGLDPNDYPTWGELAEVLGKADASQDEAEDEETIDFNSKQVNWLKKEAKERELPLKGTETKKELVAMLEKSDEDPFS